jgi:hypothetical protein
MLKCWDATAVVIRSARNGADAVIQGREGRLMTLDLLAIPRIVVPEQGSK